MSRLQRSKLRNIANHLILLAGTLFLLLPVAVVVASSTHQTSLLQTEGLQLLPGPVAVENYRQVLSLQAGFTDQITAIDMIKNSLIIASGLATLTTVLSLLASYAMVYFRFPAATALFWVTLATLLLPLESRFVTTFQVTSTLGLINTHLGMVLPALAVALGTLFFRQLFRSLPNEYLEAAKLDGAGPLRFLIDFIIPLAWRRGGAIFVVTFMIGWNQYLWPLLISTDEARYTLVRGIGLIGQESGPGMALVTLSILPPLVLILAFQRWFFRSLADDKPSL